MVFETYDAQKIEPKILEFWQKNRIFEQLREKRKKGKKFYFLDGPPYTSGKFHLAHAWNYALKDILLRYKRSQNMHVWDRNGFDVHGLPTEHKVMEKFNLQTKEDIEKFGVSNFVQECEKFCLEMAGIMTKDLARMGVTFDLSNPYMALRTKFMEGEWDLIKKAWEKKLLYYGQKVLTWCEHCETAVAKHECEYENVTDCSIFVKFPLRDKNGQAKKDEFLVIWTTTPWTIPYNLAIMAGPEIEYVKALVDLDGRKEKWILAKALAGMVIGSVIGRPMKVLDEFKGEKLEGLEYVHPFEKYFSIYNLLKKDYPKIHSVILSEQYVDTSAGTGLVHAAPGCGPEDQEACEPYGIPPFNNLLEDGYFPEEMGKFAGMRAKVDDAQFREALEREGVLLATTNVEHEYPHCWRCHKPVIFRTTSQWFFKVEDIKDKILKENKDVHWVPETALNAYEAWVSNLKDNSITRQRYWGTAIPIWKCSDEKCQHVEVIGSRGELVKLAGAEKVPENIHLPWIDEVQWPCPRCNNSFGKDSGKSSGNNSSKSSDVKSIIREAFMMNTDEKVGGKPSGVDRLRGLHIDTPNPMLSTSNNSSMSSAKSKGMMKRIPDVIDVWVDAGTVSWNCLDNDPEKMKLWYPADAILEAKEQTKLWFSMLSICSYIYLDKKSFKNVYVYGMLNDIEGKKMSKSLGNIISPYELIDKHGVDVLRYYMCQNNAGEDINFSWDECLVKQRNLLILWNLHKLLINLAQENEFDPFASEAAELEHKMVIGEEERYILSRLNSTIKNVTQTLEEYRLDEAIMPLEELYLELSRTYVQMIRDKVALGSKEKREVVISTIGKVLIELLKMFNIFVPFISEAIYQNFKEAFGSSGSLKEKSISHHLWPKYDERMIDVELENSFLYAKDIIQAALNAREKAKLGLRWPLKELVIVSSSKELKESVIEKLEGIIKTQTNAKKIVVKPKMDNVEVIVKPNYGTIGSKYGKLTPEIVMKLGTGNPQEIISSLEKKGSYELKLDDEVVKDDKTKDNKTVKKDKTVKISGEMITIEQHVPPGFVEADFKHGFIYLNTARTDELEAEGYAREVMRKVQDARKNASLEKKDRINLFICAGENKMKMWLQKFKQEIEEKTGSSQMLLSSTDPNQKYDHLEEFKVKDKSFKIFFSRL